MIREPRGETIPDEELLRRAVWAARSPNIQHRKHPRWAAIQDAFGISAEFAHRLAIRFGINPDEEVRR